MMKRFLILISILAIVSCQREVLPENENTTGKEFSASMDDGENTKTALSGQDIIWKDSDIVNIFQGTYEETRGSVYTVKDGCDGSTNTTLKPKGIPYVGSDNNYNIAVYGQVARNFDNMGPDFIAYIDLLDQQTYVSNSFGAYAMPMIAVSPIESNVLAFKNVCGVLELKFKGKDINVKSISISGNNDEQIAGVSTIHMSSSSFIPNALFDGLIGQIKKKVTLNCTSPVALNSETPTCFYITLPPVNFTNGFSVEIETDKGTITKSTSKEIRINRNEIKPMATINLEIDPRCIIEYICSDHKKITNLEGFEANVVANIFNDPKGVIVFDSPVLAIPDDAFADRCITSITLPEGVQYIGHRAFHECELQEITIPESVSMIGDYAFFRQWAEENRIIVHCEGSIPSTLGSRAFEQDDDYSLLIVVNEDDFHTYREAWDEFSTSIMVDAATVDLGLSVLWSTTNLGAGCPEGYGNYYAWGETTTKSSFNESNYIYFNGSSSSILKYNTLSSYGKVDNKTMLLSSDDAASDNWGSIWRIPSETLWKELINNCSWSQETINGIKGMRGVSNKPGYTDNSIFLPLAGDFDGNSVSMVGIYGAYLTSSLKTDRPWNNVEVYITNSATEPMVDYLIRSTGQSVRPVRTR